MTHTGMTPPEEVARYYDRNTARFLRFGGGVGALAIHRELWGPDVASAADAKRYVNRLIGDEIATLRDDATTILDLGCGVGGTLFDLGDRFSDGRMHGVTISGHQLELAKQWAVRRALADRCRFHVGDFEDLELPSPYADLAADAVVAVESFAHASNATAFFRTAARHLEPEHGRLILVDDFLVHEKTVLSRREAAAVERFMGGWRLGTLLTPAACRNAASGAGLDLIDDRDLTPFIRTGRPRDRAIAVLAPVLDGLGLVGVPFCGNMIGGDALQRGLKRGVLSYRMLTFRARRS